MELLGCLPAPVDRLVSSFPEVQENEAKMVKETLTNPTTKICRESLPPPKMPTPSPSIINTILLTTIQNSYVKKQFQ